jgi:hypothetical protein
MEKLSVSRARMPLLRRKRPLQEGLPQQEYWTSIETKTAKSELSTISHSE